MKQTKTIDKKESPKKSILRPKKESTEKKADDLVEKMAVESKVQTNSKDEDKPKSDLKVKSPSHLNVEFRDAPDKASTVVVKVEPEDQADDEQGDEVENDLTSDLGTAVLRDSTPHVDAKDTDTDYTDTKKAVKVEVEVTDSPKVTLDMGATKQNNSFPDDATKDPEAALNFAGTKKEVKVEAKVTNSPKVTLDIGGVLPTESISENSPLKTKVAPPSEYKIGVAGALDMGTAFDLTNVKPRPATLDLGVPTPETASMDFIVPKPPAAPMDLDVPAPDVATTTVPTLDGQQETSKSKGMYYTTSFSLLV